MANRQGYSKSEQEKWLAKWRASGLSAARFARQHGLNKSTLYRWVQLSGLEGPESRGVALQAPTRRAPFTEVRVRGAGTSDEASVVEGVFPSGRVVRVRGAVDVAQLRQVLQAVQAC